MKLPWRHAMTMLGWVGLPLLVSLLTHWISVFSFIPQPENQGTESGSARSNRGGTGNGQRQGAVTLISIPPSLNASFPPSLCISISSFILPSLPPLPPSFHSFIHRSIHLSIHALLPLSFHPPTYPTEKDWFHHSPGGYGAPGRGARVLMDHTAW